MPEAKLVAVLRDPVDRAYSNWMHLWSDGLEPIADFATACAAEDDRIAAGWGHFWHYRRVGLYGEQLESAIPPMSVTLRLADNLDISRGDMICRPNNAPRATQEIDAMVCWFSERPLQVGGKYAIKHTTRSAKARVQKLHYLLDVNTLRREERNELALNDVGRVSLRTATPLFVDEYRRNRITGSFILIDDATFETVGGGMILGSSGLT